MAGRYRGYSPRTRAAGGMFGAGDAVKNLPSFSACYWHLDAGEIKSYSGSGTVVYDMSRAALDSNLIATPTHTSGSAGYFSFDGSTQWIDPVASTAPYATGGGATFFVVADMTDAGSYAPFIALSIGATSDNRLLALRRDNTNNEIEFVSKSVSGTTEWSATSTGGLTYGSMASYAGTMDGANAKVYMNGVETGTTAATTVPANANRDEGGLAYDNASTDRWFTGDIAVAIIYNKGLTAEEILQLHNIFAPRYSL